MKLSDCWITLVHEAVGENVKRLHHMFSKRGSPLLFSVSHQSSGALFNSNLLTIFGSWICS